MAANGAVLFLSICIMFNICNCFVFPDDEILTGYRSNNYVVDENGWLVKNVKPKRQDSPSNQPEEPSKFVPLAKKYDEFDWRLFQAISKSSNENTITSPFSAKLLMTITREAAWGITRNEIQKALDLPAEFNGLNWFEGVVSSLEKKSTLYELNEATKVFLDKRLTPDKSFMNTAEQYFHTKTQTVNFKNTKQSAQIINDWSSYNTKGIIKELVTEEQLKEDVVAVLTNAIYFKGVWERHFEKSSTQNVRFYKNNGEAIDVPMMTKEDPAYFLETNKLGGEAKLLRLPYKGGKFAITFILPSYGNNLDKVIASIKPGLILELQKELKNETVKIYIPKFEFKSKQSLKDSLVALNIENVFTDAARLPGFGSEPIALNDVIQKAGIKIDEEGTEVAVATAGIFGTRSSGDDEPSFIANRPFAFFIEEEATGVLLFAGKVLDPSAQ